jgi:hypothetical protein
MPSTRLKIDGAVTLSFSNVDKEQQPDYVFPLFPHRKLDGRFPSMVGTPEHYSAFALPEYGSITFRCDLAKSLYKHGAGDYDKFADMIDTETLCVKAYYYPMLHTLTSFGKDFAFKDKDLATSPSVQKVFASFLSMSKEINSWAEKGCVMIEDKEHIPVKALTVRKK